MSMIDLGETEKKIVEKIDPNKTGKITISAEQGGVAYLDLGQAMEFSKLMAVSGIAIPKHLRGNVGACLAVTIQAIEWRLSPFAVANKSYSVNDRLAYEAQLVQAVILQRAPIKGRFKITFAGEADKRICKVSAELRDGGGIVDYTSPPFGSIQPKNSPLWKNDPDQQQAYYSGRALCRRHFPDVLLGIFDREELGMEPIDAPRKELTERLDALAGAEWPAPPSEDEKAPPPTGKASADD